MTPSLRLTCSRGSAGQGSFEQIFGEEAMRKARCFTLLVLLACAPSGFFEPWAIVCDAPAGVDSSETSMISD